MIEVLYSGPTSLEVSRSVFSREDHRMKELSLLRGNKRAPRRSQTQFEYQLPQPPAFTIHMIRQQPETAEDSTKKQKTSSDEAGEQAAGRSRAPVRRPPLGPPRRSYSVTDQEPLPYHHRPSTRLALTDLPAELHYAIFDFLDPIDSTCLGLTNRHFYAIHRRMHGTVPLSARRDGPNELEWAWHLAGNIIRTNPSAADGKEAIAPLKGLGKQEKNVLSKLRIRGQAYCRKCGVTRCQLHKHIQDWMGEGLEYCSVKQKFGPVAPEGAKSYCYMSRPGDTRRCGRHYVRKSKVVLQ
ncbi:F-box domain containing protein [Madurella fahalii]|uniref:F-box domain containing protein n=1 Tax=Madurella fahalii TaxID=1157608 RepID=A0ABQ0GEQ1_9PEZI